MRPALSRFTLTVAGLALVVGCGANTTGGSGADGAAGADHAEVTPAAGEAAEHPQGGEGFDVVLRDVEGSEVGTVTLSPVEGGVQVEGTLEGLSVSGYHGFHVHQRPACDAAAPDGPFTTAGGHYNPTDAEHGQHSGDLPPLLFNEEGGAHVLAVTDRFTLDELRGSGGALIVHAEADNLAHIPDRYRATNAPTPGPDEQTNATGDGGARIACGVIPKA